MHASMTARRCTRAVRHLAVLAILCVVVVTPALAAASAPVPSIAGPIPVTAIPGTPAPGNDYVFFATNHDLATNGFVEEEFYVTGAANQYTTPPLTTATSISSGNPYRTRVVVRRPADPRKFNGTVLVEWLNVTNGFDADNTWFFVWEHVLRAGYAWVGVSAQRVGVEQLRGWNPARYAGFNVSGPPIPPATSDDSLCYDVFSQVASALRQPGASGLLGALRPKVFLGIGESQSASRLATYVNSIHPLARVYDGYLLLSALGGKIRTDLDVPVWKISTEYDVAQVEARARQPDTDRIRLWEIAGTSHVDQHLRLSREPLELRDHPTNLAAGTSAEAVLAPQCGVPTIGTRVPAQHVLASALDLLVRWATRGTPPPSAPPIDVLSLETAPKYSVLARDALGLAEGGIRLAAVAAPTALNNGVNSGPGACVRWGYYAPFTVDQLDQLYRSHQAYVEKVVTTARQNVRDGYILAEDARQTIVDAMASDVGPGAPDGGRWSLDLGSLLDFR